MELLARDADVFVKLQPLFAPVFQELGALLGPAEILELHLLEFAGAEGVVARIDFVAKSFADLRDAERKLFARDIEHVAELHKDCLRRLGPKIHLRLLIVGGAMMRLEHEVERARLGEIGAAAHGALLFSTLLGNLILAQPRLARPAVHHRVAESLLVPARLPDCAIHQNGTVHADDVVPLVHHRPPPVVLEIALQLRAERAVVPAAVQSAVDLAGLKDEAAPLAEAYDFFHSGGVVFRLAHRALK